MKKIAILIPTINRSGRLAKLVKNIHETTKTPHTIYFIIERSDSRSREKILKLRENIIINELREYVGAINTGYLRTKEPFIFCGSDDLEFTKGWDKECLKVMQNRLIGITGPTDSWEISKTGLHVSHLFIRRDYIVKHSGVEDERDVIYSNKYIHIMCDIETEQTAMKRKMFKAAPKAFVEHNHWFMGTASKDATYERADRARIHDEGIYNSRRKNFEQYRFEDLFHGKIVSTKPKELTCVLLSFGVLPYLQETVASLVKNTKTRFDLIIIDNASDLGTRAWIQNLDLGPDIKISKVFHMEQKYFTYSINEGARMANTKYVAFLNNDILFSKGWEIPLMRELDNEMTWLANPYQNDPGEIIPYGKAERAGNIDIRGTCFMLKKEIIDKIAYDPVNFLPPQLLLWFSDSWLARQVTYVYKKHSVFNPKSVIYHYGSKSTQTMNPKEIWLTVRGDAYAYWQMTGEDTTKWIKIAEERAGI